MENIKQTIYHPLSKCCRATVRLAYVCEKCGKSCDLAADKLPAVDVSTPHSAGYLAIDPLCQILADFHADTHTENPDGKTKIIRYDEWVAKIRALFDCACGDPMKPEWTHSKYDCHGKDFGILRAGTDETHSSPADLVAASREEGVAAERKILLEMDAGEIMKLIKDDIAVPARKEGAREVIEKMRAKILELAGMPPTHNNDLRRGYHDMANDILFELSRLEAGETKK